MVSVMEQQPIKYEYTASFSDSPLLLPVPRNHELALIEGAARVSGRRSKSWSHSSLAFRKVYELLPGSLS